MKTAPLRFALLCCMACLSSPPALADYTTREDVRLFIDEIATRNHLDPAPIRVALARARFDPRVV